ncbi:LytR/AlgR family response regulator transcription factor [Marinilactibacillus kalidii]|uniref:LytR/AlgR family response regulator transcription factor n=1 Tax=Marinilactibacillus kalidii TaxID=2820274 RepID=UPI001ABE394D|nr:LytTR family DNA-binding domain-containing protein [Marinilactibacillus kalidii]
MKIAVVEDNPNTRKEIKAYIEESSRHLSLHVDIDLYEDGVVLVDKFDAKYDIIYLDVEMEIMDGMTTAKKIRERDSEVVIVFITNHGQVAIQGYSVDAADFLLKPLKPFTFNEHFKKITKKVTVKSESIIVKIAGNLRKINLSDIQYIESQGHYIKFKTINETFTIIDTLKNIQTKLDNDFFFRSSNSIIVNLNHIDKVEKNTIFIDDEKLDISRARKKAFIDRFTIFLGESVL